MSLSSELRNEFIVYIISSDVEEGAKLKANLTQEGYDSYLFTSGELAFEALKNSAPHVLVLNENSLEVPMEEFVQEVLKVNPEIKFLPLVSIENESQIIPYKDFRFSRPILKTKFQIEKMIWAIDEICHDIFLTYQNEQVYDELLEKKSKLESLSADIKDMRKKIDAGTQIPLRKELNKYQSTTSKEEVLQIFLKELNQKFLNRNKKISAIYFKFLPTVQSFVAVQSLGIDIDSLKGIGGRLTEEESKDPIQHFSNGRTPKELSLLMNDGLQVKTPIMKSIFVKGLLDGFFVFWSENQDIFQEEIENEFALFSMVYERGHFIRHLNQLDLSDNVTELYGRNYYLKHLAEEVARARRLQKAVSVIKISVDHLTEIQQSLGRGGRDQILKSVSQLIQKSSRVNDICCRTGESEFSLILPHSAKKGASLRAERLRRMIESHGIQAQSMHYTISCGVSEYPSLCQSAEDLEKTAGQALEFIVSKGGNKVCLFQPLDGFQPDYKIPQA